LNTISFKELFTLLSKKLQAARLIEMKREKLLFSKRNKELDLRKVADTFGVT